MLTIRGAKNVAAAIAHYKAINASAVPLSSSSSTPSSRPLSRRPSSAASNAADSEPPNIHGSLWKSGRRGARFFKTEPGTPLLLYFRSRRLVENNVVAAHSALNLAFASKIAVVAQNGVGTHKFVIQSSNANDPTSIEHVELSATSPDEARRWVTTLIDRRNHFLAHHAPSDGKRPSQQDLVKAGRELFKRATDDGQVMLQVVRSSDLRKADLKRNTSTGSARDESEVYFSASSDDDDEDGEPKSEYMSAQQRLETSIEELGDNPPSLMPKTMWREPSYEGVPLRGFNYLNDHRKIRATRTLMRLVAVDAFSTGKSRYDNIAGHASNRMEIARKAGTLPPFTWVIVIQVPGSPHNYSFVMYYAPMSMAIAKLFDVENVDDKEAEHIAGTLGLPPNFPRLLRKFFFGKDDKFRDERFKMVPTIEEGPWLVKNAVPSKPALMGTKLTCRYFLNQKYMELDLDVGSSSVAKNITQLSIGYSTKIVVNLSFVLEGRDSSELPEEIMGIISVINADLVKNAVPLAV